MTFSIVARCPKENCFGVAVATAVPNVRSRVPHVEAENGAIATQAMTNIAYGIEGLKLLRRGFTSHEVLKRLLAGDSEREHRQVIIVDRAGRTAGFTGEYTQEFKGHILGVNYAVAGNLLKSPRVLKEMCRAFLNSSDKKLAERLLLALEAGKRAGGDKRGVFSAALIVKGSSLRVDISVSYSYDPVGKLRALYYKQVSSQ